MKCDGRNPDPEKWTRHDKELIANILDSKGVLTVKRPRVSSGKLYYDPRFYFREKSRTPIDLCEKYGGTWHGRPKGSGIFSWYISRNSKLFRVLQAIEPHVKIKVGLVRLTIEMLLVLRDQPSDWREKCAIIYDKLMNLDKNN